MKIFLLLSLLLPLQAFAIKSIRGEANRFKLLKDRITINRNLITSEHTSFFHINLNISSSVKDFIGEISSSTSKESSSDQLLAVNSVFGKYVNTERLLDLYLELAFPLPVISISSYTFLPSIFASAELGTSISINNQIDATNLKAQVYLQKEIKYGLSSKIKSNARRDLIFSSSLYMRTRADINSQKSANAVVNDGDIVSLDEIKKEEVYLVSDLGVTKVFNPNKELFVEIRDLSLWELSSERKSTFGQTPLIHTNLKRIYQLKDLTYEILYGLHYRNHYSLFDGAYLGTNIIFKENPIKLLFKIDNQFIFFNAGLAFKHLAFSYGYKTAYINPQSDIWVSGIHNINLNIPF